MLLVLFAALMFFKEDIKKICLDNISEVLATEVSLSAVEFQWIQSFPKVTLHIENLKIKESLKSSQDSLLVIKSINLGFDITELFRGNFVINSCKLSNGYIHLKFFENGSNNFSILKETNSSKEQAPFSFKIDELELENVEIEYWDLKANQKHKIFALEAQSAISHIKNLTHLGIDGQFICLQLGIGNEAFLEKKPFSVDAKLTYDSDKRNILFNNSKLTLEKALFEIDGNIFIEQEKYWNLKIGSPNTDVQAMVSLLPHEISKDLLEYKSTGNLYFSGKIIGLQSATQSPLIEFDFGFKNASFYHPKVEQKITKAQLQGKFSNGKNRNNSTSLLSLKNFSGYLGKDLLSGNILIKNFDNPYLDVDLKGDFNIAAALKLYPVKKIKSATGVIEADVNFKGKLSDLTDVKKTQFIKTSGKFVIKDLNFQLEDVGVDFKAFNGKFFFEKHDLGISKLVGNVGKSDFELKGFFKNFIAYVLLDHEILKIQAEFNSQFLDLNEILSKAMNESEVKTTKTNSKNYSFRLSPFLAYDLNCHIKKIDFRNLSGQFAGKDLSAKLQLRDQILNYQNLSMDVANGFVQMSGVINASDSSKIKVRNNTKIENLNVKQAFFIVENFGQKFITDKNLDGVLTANIETLMNFDAELKLDINSISSIAEVKIKNGALINFDPMQEIGVFLRKKAYSKYLKSSNFNKVSFSELSNTFYINKSVIEIPEMVVQSDLASDLTITGTHSFDNKINYKVSFPLVNYTRDERLEEKGIVLDNKKRWYLYLTIKGTVENYVIDIDQNKSLKSAVSAASERVIDLFKEEKEEDKKIIPLDTSSTMDYLIMEEL